MSKTRIEIEAMRYTQSGIEKMVADVAISYEDKIAGLHIIDVITLELSLSMRRHASEEPMDVEEPIDPVVMAIRREQPADPLLALTRNKRGR